MKEMDGTNLSRRDFLRRLGLGAGSAMAMMALEPLSVFAREKETGPVTNRMTYRVQHGTGDCNCFFLISNILLFKLNFIHSIRFINISFIV